MNGRLVMALCLPLMLSFIRVKGQPIVAMSTDVDGTLVNLEEPPNTTADPSALAPTPMFEPEMEPSIDIAIASPAPSTVQRSRFEVQIDQAISQCRRRGRRTTCSWRSRRIVISQGRIVERQVSDDFCCCACRRTDECQAIHYERLEGRCVFHEGPIGGDQRQNDTIRWLKE